MIVGQHGPAVVLSAETAYYLETVCKVAALRQRLRDGRHPQVSQELLHLRHVAMRFDPARLPQNPEVGSESAEVDPALDQGLMTVAEVADLLGIGERAVRLACAEDRLDAEQVGGRWQITRDAYENFKTARAA